MKKRSTFKMNGSWRKMRRFARRTTQFRDTTTSNPAPNEWKRVISKLKAEKAELKAHYGKEILKLKLHQAFGSSSDKDI